ncbi:ATP-grasp domain-containing protein [Candidatus Gottesmanbacteria bacterium]|nr:ATP-grasp domain-containing protein [Candidatus Gottesmanbacteria bacterium]
MIKKYASAELLYAEAFKLGLNPHWESPHGLFSIQYKGKDIFIFYTKLHINSQLGAWMSQDKYLTHIILKKYNLPDIPYCYTTQIKTLNIFFDKHHPIIQKPVLGQRAEDVFLIQKRNEIRQGTLQDWIFEKYMKGKEYRCLVLKGKVIAMQEKILSPTGDYHWRKIIRNLAEKDWNKQMVIYSIKISKIFQLGLMAVDFILDSNRKIWILETNSMPSLYAFHNPDKGPKLNVAKQVLREILSTTNTPLK